MSDRRARWRASRAGLINIFEYGDQVFCFGGGRLLLRGPNGSGKSKALELLFPFLFDGDMSPRKLDPFGKQARKMKWNLLMDGKHAARTGYAWFEIRHDDPRARPRYATFGVCLQAHKEWDDVKARFFYVPDRRVGIDFELVGANRVPLIREQLQQLVSELGGETFGQANHYQERLNQVAFGYPSLKRLAQQIRLQRTLRRPQLSDTLDEQLLNELLSDALPEIEIDQLERASRRLDQIEESRVRLETLKRNERAVREFSGTYGDYARAELRERRDALVGAAMAAEQALEQHDRGAGELAAAQKRHDAVATALEQTHAELDRLRETERTLLSSPEMKAAAEIARARERLAAARDHVERAGEQRTKAADELERAERRHAERERQLAGALSRFTSELARLALFAESAGIGAHEQLAPQLAGDGGVGAALEQLERAARERRGQIDEVRRRRALADDKAELAKQQAERCEAARALAEDARTALSAADKELARSRGQLADAAAAWVEALKEAVVDETLRTALETAVDAAGAPEAERLNEIVTPTFTAAETLLARVGLELDRRAEELVALRAPLEAERAELEAAVDPVPAPLPTRAAREAGRAGAPFWALVDFDPSLAHQERGGLEGALEGAGLLDAWVLPDGVMLATGTDDVALVPAELGDGPSLADHLRTLDDEQPVAAEVVERILRSIGTDHSGEQGCVVSLEGSFAFGPARGAHPKERAQFIGAAARADNRARRLAELAAALATIAADEQALTHERELLAGRTRTLADERRSFPPEQEVRRAHAALVRARQDAEAARRDSEAAELASIETARAADLARGDVEIFATRFGLDPDGDDGRLSAVAAQVDRYADTLATLREADFDRRGALALIDRLSGELGDARGRLDERREDRERAEGELRAADGHLSGLEALSEGAERALARAAELAGQIESGSGRSRELSDEQIELARTTAALEERLKGAAGDVAASERARGDAILALRAYVHSDLLALALGERGLAPDKEQALAWEVEEWRRFFGGLNHDLLTTRAALETLQNQIDRDYETLRQQVDSSQLQISRERVNELLTVRGYAHGSEQPLATLIDSLAEEVAESEQRISEEDRRLFEEFVTGGIADHLHLRINEAKETVERMNEEIAKVQASSGMSIDVRWQRLDDGGPALRRALELLQAAPTRLTSHEQRDLQEFIREQVKRARLEAEQTETTLSQLATALDYRRWHTFKLRKRNAAHGGEARELTRHEHDSGSGGEKAISLHLPLLAAAASYPASGKADALRMVMLDEAFARIDDEGRRGIMGLIANFDLDIMLTSPDFWGFFPEVPELSVYALAPRDPRHPGVVSRRFHWDGASKREISQQLPWPGTNGHGPNGNRSDKLPGGTVLRFDSNGAAHATPDAAAADEPPEPQPAAS